MIDMEARSGEILYLGRKGENKARRILFRLGHWRELYGDGTATLLAQRPGEKEVYPVALEETENGVAWTVTAADLVLPGRDGKCELQYHVNDTIAKSDIWQTQVLDAMGEAGEPLPEPEQGWVDQVLQAGTEALEAAERAGASAETARQAADAAEKFLEQTQKTAQETADRTAQATEQLFKYVEAAETARDTAENFSNTAGAKAAEAAQSAREANDAAKIAAENAVQAADSADKAEKVSTHPPIIRNGNWWTWSAETGSYTDSGVDASVSLTIGNTITGAAGTQAKVTNRGTETDPIFDFTIPKGDTGDTWTPSVSAAGVLSWTKNSGTAPAEANIKGPKGDTGPAGPTGPQGPQGPAGSGSGDMLASIYDPQGNAQDIFAYADKAGAASVNGGKGDVVVGGRNLLLDSGKPVSDTEDLLHSYYLGSIKPVEGETYTVSFKGTLGEGKTHFAVYNSGSNVMLVGSSTTNGFGEPDENGVYQAAFTWKNSADSYHVEPTFLRFFHYPSSVKDVVSTIEWAKLERGTVPTDWSPAPEDLQPKLTGKTGQIVGFDPQGNAIPQDAPENGITQEQADSKYSKVAITRSVTLTASGWDSTAKSQTVTVSGVSADELAQLVTPTPAQNSQQAYIDAGIRCTGQAAGKLTFTCGTVPAVDLTVYVVIQPLT